MKISVFGKSGPRLVTEGLVCACAATDQPVKASTIRYPRNRLGMFGSCSKCWKRLARSAALSRHLQRETARKPREHHCKSRQGFKVCANSVAGALRLLYCL